MVKMIVIFYLLIAIYIAIAEDRWKIVLPKLSSGTSFSPLEDGDLKTCKEVYLVEGGALFKASI